MLPDFLTYDASPKVENLKQVVRLIALEASNWPQFGTNAEVFYYQPGSVDQYGITPMMMTFYGASKVFVSFCPEGVTPPHRTQKAQQAARSNGG